MTDDRSHGEVIVRADVVGTVIFAATAVFAATVFTTPAQWVGAVTAISLFAVGCIAFLWAFYNAVQRSRTEQISVTELYLLLGEPTPRRVRRIMSTMLFVQCAVALITAFARPNTADGSAGSSLALGFLVPMFGLGMNGLWAAFHGVFPPRDDAAAGRPASEQAAAEHDVRTSTAAIDKNDHHG